jgi:hypothetical protein
MCSQAFQIDSLVLGKLSSIKVMVDLYKRWDNNFQLANWSLAGEESIAAV